MVAYTEYAVEINDEKGFVRQVDIFPSYEAAVDYAECCDDTLEDGEYFNIIFIDYNEYGDEIAFGTVC